MARTGKPGSSRLQRPVHHLGAREGLGVERGRLLELQRRLGRHRQGGAAAHHIGRGGLGENRQGRGPVLPDGGVERFGQARHGGAQGRVVGPFGDQRGEGGGGGHAGLGGGDAALEPGAERHHGIGTLGEGRALLVHHRDREGAGGPGRALQRHDVGALARLRHRDHDGALEPQRRPVERGHRGADRGHRHAEQDLAEVFEEGRGIVRGAARRGDHDGWVPGSQPPPELRQGRALAAEQPPHGGGRVADLGRHEGLGHGSIPGSVRRRSRRCRHGRSCG